MNIPQTPSPLVAPRGFVVPPDVLTIPVVVDTNEARSGLPELLRERGVNAAVRPLDVGDVEIGAQIVIERKTVADLLLSIRQGRLFRQAYRLKVCERPLVLVEGDPYELVHCDDIPQVRGALLSLLVGYRIPVVQTSSLDETVACLVQLALQQERRSRRRRRRELDANQSKDVRALLEACPTIGPSRARALIEAFGCIRGVATARVEALTRVPGIGALTATRILEVMTTKPTARPRACQEEPRTALRHPRGRHST